MNLKKLLVSALVVCGALTATAVPAKRGLQTVTQPDGTEIRIQRAGDERMHFLMTEDRMILVEENGGYYYADIDEKGALVNTGVLAGEDSARDSRAGAAPRSFDDLDLAHISQLRAQARGTQNAGRRSIAQSGMGRFTSDFPRTGKIRGLVILVQYTDVKFKVSDPLSFFNDMLNQDGFNQYNGTGSAHDYFIENSGGQFDPQFDVYGPYTLPNKMSYYGGNDSNGNDKAPEDMVIHACKGLDSQIDFTQYDMDNDGYVDNVFIFYAGQGEASYGTKDSVWPHQWELSSARKSLTLDGKKIDRYACSNEWEQSRPDGIGTFVHEFSHVMGLPDLYQTDGGEDCVTPGEWSVLDYGPYNNDGRTPPAYSIYERNAMGWCEPRVLDGPESVTLEHVLTSNDGCLIPTNTDTEFFLLENRQQTGWDKYLPGHGMLIWHVDFKQTVWDSNAVNNTKTHQYVEIERANNSSYTTAGWSWPGTSRKTTFSDTTTPSMKPWTGSLLDMPVTGITESGDIITFDIAGGGTRIPAPVVVPNPTLSGNGFTAAWNAVEGATDYLLTVTASYGTPAVSENYDSSTLPDGWTKTANSTYNSTGNYKTGSQSVKLDASNQYVQTRVYDNDVAAISFWAKGQGSNGSTLAVTGLINGSWQNIKTYKPVNNKSEDVTVDNIPAGVRQVRFTYTKTKGNMSLDDITVTTGGGTSESVEGFDKRSTAGQTSMFVDLSAYLNTSRADEGYKFSFNVIATDGNSMSRPSETVYVNMDNSGIDSIIADDGTNVTPEYYNMQGVRVTNPGRGLYLRRSGSKVEKVVIR